MFLEKLFSKILVGILLTLLTLPCLSNQTLDVLFFNDYHGQVLEDSANHIPGMAKFTTAVKQVEAKHPNYILVSGGDNFMGPLISNIYNGQPIVKMMRYLNVKASAVGNHEFDWGAWRMAPWSRFGNFTFVSANIIDKRFNKTPRWAKPYVIIKKGGLKIAFIGLATQETKSTTKSENIKTFTLKDDLESLQTWIDYLNGGKDSSGKPNAIIALTHIPSWQEHKSNEITGDEITNILKNVHGLDAFISAHSHQLVAGKINNIPVLQAGCYGRAIGDFTLVFDDQGKLLKISSQLDILSDKIESLSPNKAMQYQADFYHQKIAKIMDQKIGEATAPFEHNHSIVGASTLGELISEAELQTTHAQVAIINYGGIRQSLGKGAITIGKIHNILPFDNYLINFKLSGASLKKIIEHGILNSKIGWSQFAGLKVTYDPKKPTNNHIVKFELADGTPIKDDQLYSVTTVDFIFDGGDGYNFTDSKDVERTKILLRDAAINMIRKEKVITPKPISTITLAQ